MQVSVSVKMSLYDKENVGLNTCIGEINSNQAECAQPCRVQELVQIAWRNHPCGFLKVDAMSIRAVTTVS